MAFTNTTVFFDTMALLPFRPRSTPGADDALDAKQE